MIPPLAALLRLHETNSALGNVDPHAARSRELVRLLQALTPEMHRRYVNAHRRHGHSAVAAIEHGACGGCHMRLPASPPEVDESIYACDHCGRLLYDRDEAFEYAVG
jgi:predicted  nucleic acid-binding Zn-ribbon protein